MSLEKLKEFDSFMEETIKKLKNIQKQGSSISKGYHSIDIKYSWDDDSIDKVRLCCEIIGDVEDYELRSITLEDSEIDITPILTATQLEEIYELINEKINDLP